MSTAWMLVFSYTYRHRYAVAPEALWQEFWNLTSVSR